MAENKKKRTNRTRNLIAAAKRLRNARIRRRVVGETEGWLSQIRPLEMATEHDVDRAKRDLEEAIHNLFAEEPYDPTIAEVAAHYRLATPKEIA